MVASPQGRTAGRTASLARLFRQYAEAHRHPLNRLCHELAIPVILLTLVALLDRVPLGDLAGLRVTAAMPALLAAGAWYLWMDLRLGPVMGLLLLACLPLGRWLPTGATVALAVVAWGIQFVGHFAFERRQPSFFTNLVQALVGPIYFVDAVLGGVTRRGAREVPPPGDAGAGPQAPRS